MGRYEENCKMSASMYGHTYTWESDNPDCTMEEFLDAFYGLMVGLTFQPVTIISAMKEYADGRINQFKDKSFNDEDGDF